MWPVVLTLFGVGLPSLLISLHWQNQRRNHVCTVRSSASLTPSLLPVILNFIHNLFRPDTVQPLPGNSIMNYSHHNFFICTNFQLKFDPQHCTPKWPYLHFKRHLLSGWFSTCRNAPEIYFKSVSNVRLQISLTTKLPKITIIWSRLTKL